MATAVKSLPPEFPIFVKTDDDRIRWKASEDFARAVFGLKPNDVDMLGYLARAVYDSEEIPTDGLLGAASDRPVQDIANTVPDRFDEGPEADPMLMREAIREAKNVTWIEDPDAGGYSSRINNVFVSTDFILSQQSVARLCYLTSPITKSQGKFVTLRLTTSSAPNDDLDNPAMVNYKDGLVTYWQADNLVAGGTKIDEPVFDYTVALAMQKGLDEEKYRVAALADQIASLNYGLKYQKKYSRSLGDDIGPVVVIGALFSTIFGKDQPLIADFTDSIAVWFQAQRHGRLNGWSGLANNVKFSDVFPNRDRYFRSW